MVKDKEQLSPYRGGDGAVGGRLARRLGPRLGERLEDARMLPLGCRLLLLLLLLLLGLGGVTAAAAARVDILVLAFGGLDARFSLRLGR